MKALTNFINEAKKTSSKIAFAGATMFYSMMNEVVAFAGGNNPNPQGGGAGDAQAVADSVTAPLNQVISVVLSILAVVGVFMLIKAIAELVNAIQDQQSSGIYHAARGIAAGALMISIKLLVSLFGYNF